MPAAAQQSSLAPGQTLGDFRVTREIGRGPSGVVYEAAHKDSGQRVAAKVLLPPDGADPQLVARFPFNARSVSLVRHPHLCELVSFGLRPDSSAYLVSELLAGETVRERLGRGPLPVADALRVARQVAQALAVAEDVSHLNLHPGNVMLVPAEGGEAARVLDFGVARLAGALGGADGYRAPEQAERAAPDGRSDVYALGALLHAMLVGVPPEAGAASPIQGPAGALIAAMMAPAPASRPTMREVAERLGEIAGTAAPAGAEAAAKKPTATRAPGPSTLDWAAALAAQKEAERARRRGQERRSRRPGLPLILGTLLVIALGLGAVAFLRSRPPQEAGQTGR